MANARFCCLFLGLWMAGCGSAAQPPVGWVPAESSSMPDLAARPSPASLETRLSAAIAALHPAFLAAADNPTASVAATRQVRDLAATLATHYRAELLTTGNANLRAWLQLREAPPIRPTADLGRLIYGSATGETIDRRWRQQAETLELAIRGLAAGEKPATGLWLYWQDSQDGREAGRDFFRAEAIRNAAADLIKLQELLIDPPPETKLEKGELIFEDNFAALAPNWKAYGDPTVTVADGRLQIAGEACAVWLEQDFENVLIAFDYTPKSLSKNAGALFAFPAQPLPGHDWADAAGPMERYNRTIQTYHCSLCRGGSGMTNLRRTGTGLRMLSTVQPDPCAELNKTYRVEILSARGSLYVFVDGVLQHAYADAGVYGPIPRRGRFGLRLFAGGTMEMAIGHFQVWRVQE